MKRTSLVVLAVGVGIVVGLGMSPVLRSSTASAQTGPNQTQSSNVVSTFLDKLASALHIERTKLDQAITTAADGTAADAVQKGQLTQAQADRLKQRLATGGVWGDMGRGRPGKMFMFDENLLNAAATALKETPAALKSEIQSGKTLDQIAAAHNTTAQAVKDAVLKVAKADLDKAVAANKMTQEQADAAYQKLQSANGWPFFAGPHGSGKGRGHRPGQNATPAQPGSSATPSTSGL